MRVALLHNQNRGKSEHETEFDLPITIDALTDALSDKHEVVPVEGTRDFAKWTSELAAACPDIVFNVAEGYRGAAREALYPTICEQLDLPYTGPGPTELLICHNKDLTKRLLREIGIPLAWSRLLGSPADLESLQKQEIPFPLIVKLNSEGSSLGMDGQCIVRNFAELERQVRKVWGRFQTDILAEKYVDGIDLSTSFVEGMGVFGPVQYTYPTGSIYDYQLKSTSNHQVGVENPKDLPEQWRDRVLGWTKRIVEFLDLNGYGRADFRLDTQTQELAFLEMNAQVCFHPDGAFILSVTNDTPHSYADVVSHIVDYAAAHRRRISRVGRHS
ncbi:MAG: hypothetical protein PHS73_00475 [Candidatus Peribacteraceae bacterium]|nr:hypothetical protein [Candidatus Peribacteraceae bacterium]